MLVLQTCNDSSSGVEEVEETPAMSISAEAPESVDFGEVYSVAITGQNANVPVDPVICMDESPRQLIAETRRPQPMVPGRKARFDHEYRRCGVCSVLLRMSPWLFCEWSRSFLPEPKSNGLFF